MTGYVLTALIALIIGYDMGWSSAHLVIATECERIGSLFVGQKVFKCELKTDGSQK